MVQSEVRTAGARGTAPDDDPPPPRPGLHAGSTTGLVVKIVVLGVILAVALWAVAPLVAGGSWLGVAVVVLVTALLFAIYLSPRQVPLKYLIPGTLLLIAFQVFPVLLTISTAFTNFGDGHRGSKEETIAAIEGASVQPAPGSAPFALTIATEGDPADVAAGELVFLLADPDGATFTGTADGLAPLEGATVGPDGRITAAPGYTVLSLVQAAVRGGEVTAFAVPGDGGTIRAQGASQAFLGAPRQSYDPGCDCITDPTEGRTWVADGSVGSFVEEGSGQVLPQGWQVGVGFGNFADVLGNPAILTTFLGLLVWDLVFAAGSVALTFAFGLLMALALNHERLRGQRVYRSLLILPYAMPAFAMYLVWRDMFNTDFGLVNRLFGIDVNWFGTALTAQIAVLLVQLWLGYSYMFLVCTGALQSIPADLTEAASVDGARPLYAFRTITFPLLLVALAPLLISSFAFNFNNFAAIYLVSEGGPFPPDNPSAGATDILITYTYRLAFGGQGAQYGLAATLSIFIFIFVALISVVGFRRTRALEEIN